MGFADVSGEIVLRQRLLDPTPLLIGIADHDDAASGSAYSRQAAQ